MNIVLPFIFGFVASSYALANDTANSDKDSPQKTVAAYIWELKSSENTFKEVEYPDANQIKKSVDLYLWKDGDFQFVANLTAKSKFEFPKDTLKFKIIPSFPVCVSDPFVVGLRFDKSGLVKGLIRTTVPSNQTTTHCVVSRTLSGPQSQSRLPKDWCKNCK